METFNLIISTPQRLFYSGEAEQIILTSTEGEMGILPGHVPVVVAIESSPIRIKTAEGWREAALSDGFAQIRGDEVAIIADTAEWPEEIEFNRAVEAKARAEERITHKHSEIEYLRSQVALKRALARLKVTHKKF